MRHFWLIGLLACNPGTDTTDPSVDSEVEAPALQELEPVDRDRYEADLTTLAVAREPGAVGWQAAQDLCADRLASLGFAVERHAYDSGTNVIGRLAGSDSAGSVVLSAHYDSVSGCEGADDNASGVAAALEAARVLADGDWANDLVVACWDEEERGLLGSQSWTARAAEQGEAILASVSLEMVAYTSSEADSQSLPLGFDLLFPDVAAQLDERDYRGDFLAAVSDLEMTPFLDAMDAHAPDGFALIRIDLEQGQLTSPLLGDLQRSDHASFWIQGYPSSMLTDTADFRYGGYHCFDGEDSVDRLDLAFAVDVTTAVAGGAAEILAGR
jgi:hypothetical protein